MGVQSCSVFANFSGAYQAFSPCSPLDSIMVISLSFTGVIFQLFLFVFHDPFNQAVIISALSCIA